MKYRNLNVSGSNMTEYSRIDWPDYERESLGLWRQKQLFWAKIINYIPENTVRCDFLFVS